VQLAERIEQALSPVEDVTALRAALAAAIDECDRLYFRELRTAYSILHG
jgi:hypothetical protein